MPSDLADGGGLAGAVDAYHEDHRRRMRHVDPGIALIEMRRGDVPQLGQKPGRVGDYPGVGLGFESCDDRDRRVHSDVGKDQRFLYLLPQILVEPVEEHGGKLLLQGFSALDEAVAQLREPSSPQALDILGGERSGVLIHTDEHLRPVIAHAEASSAAGSMRCACPRSARALLLSPSLLDNTRDVPSASSATPYSVSATSMV